MNIHEKLIKIQNELKVPKEQYNKFGKYNFRSCEDIVENSKPILKEHGLLLLLDDEIVNIGERYYVKATAKLTDGEESIVVTGYAREEENKKGMDSMQLTGATSSYARKYALNGLFAIDDTKDSDSYNKHGKEKDTQKKNNTKKNTKNKKERENIINEYYDNDKKREKLVNGIIVNFLSDNERISSLSDGKFVALCNKIEDKLEAEGFDI